MGDSTWATEDVASRWFHGQIERLGKERDRYKALAEERDRKLQVWEKALQLMPTRGPLK